MFVTVPLPCQPVSNMATLRLDHIGYLIVALGVPFSILFGITDYLWIVDTSPTTFLLGSVFRQVLPIGVTLFYYSE